MKSCILYFVHLFLIFLPETRCYAFKRILLRIAGAKIGKNVRICSSVHIIGNGLLSIGDDSFIGPHTFIHVSSSIIIGKNCDISSKVTILNGTHEIDVSGAHVAGKGKSLDVQIDDGSWICTNSVILGGTHIGKMSILAASSTAKGVYPDNSLLKGCIAKFSHTLKN